MASFTFGGGGQAAANPAHPTHKWNWLALFGFKGQVSKHAAVLLAFPTPQSGLKGGNRGGAYHAAPGHSAAQDHVVPVLPQGTPTREETLSQYVNLAGAFHLSVTQKIKKKIASV